MLAFSSKDYHETRRADRSSEESEEKSESASEDYAHDSNSKCDNKDSHNCLFLILWREAGQSSLPRRLSVSELQCSLKTVEDWLSQICIGSLTAGEERKRECYQKG